jgi:hypothetical protein
MMKSRVTFVLLAWKRYAYNIWPLGHAGAAERIQRRERRGNRRTLKVVPLTSTAPDWTIQGQALKGVAEAVGRPPQAAHADAGRREQADVRSGIGSFTPSRVHVQRLSILLTAMAA